MCNSCMFLPTYSWLLEINASPSLTASSPADYDLKVGLLLDVLNIVDMENRYWNLIKNLVHLMLKL